MKFKRIPIIKSSTRDFIEEGKRTPGYSLLDWLHGYVYARWVYLYIGIGIGEHPLSKKLAPLWGWMARIFVSNNHQSKTENLDEQSAKITFADTYHGKVLPLASARQLVMVQEEIHLTNLEKIIPYSSARDIILKNPTHILALECPCRSSRPDPCLPLDVCLIVGEPFASFAAEHHPHRSRWLSQQQAMEIIQAEHERGHVQHAFFKDAMLGRFYAICNCCSCCCGAMQAHRNGTPMLASSGYVSQLDGELCAGCGTCVTACPFSAIEIGATGIEIDQEACMGCGVCVSQCENLALSLVRAPAKGEPLEIMELMNQKI